MQPFHAPADMLHQLAILQSLSNGDKHRALQVVRRSQVPIGDITVTPTPAGPVASTVNSGPIEEGAVVSRVEFIRPDASTDVRVSGEVAWYESVAYERRGAEVRWLRIDQMLNAIGPAVLDAVIAVRTAAGLHD